MTTSKKTTNLTELFEDPNGFVSTPRTVTKISENFTKVSSFILINKMFDFFTRKGKEFGIFSLPELAKICKKSESTVREALKETKEKGALIVEDIPNIGKLIMINKQKNKKFLKDYLEGKETLYIPHKNKIGGSVDATPPSDTQEGQVVNSVLEIQSTLPLNRVESIVNSDLCQSPIDPIILDPKYIDHHHREELKTSTENLTQDEILNDDDFLNKFDNESTNLISTEIKSSKENEVTKVLPQEAKDSLTNKIDSVGAGEKTNIPPVRPAYCGQAVDNLRDKLITLFDNTDIDEDFRDKILTKYSNEYELIIKGLEIMSYQENIKNQTGWLNKFLEKKGLNYSLPAQLKQKELNQSKETAKHRLAPIIKVFREWYRDNENLDLAKSSLFFSMKELYRQNSQRFIDKVHYCKSQFENFNELTKELFHGEILEIIEAV